MAWFNNLKIKTKLISGFVLIILFSVLIGLVGVAGISDMQKSDKVLYDSVTVPITLAGAIQNNFQKVRVTQRDVLLAQTPEEKQKHKDEIASLRAEMDKLCSDFDKFVSTNEERTAYNNLLSARKEYTVHLKKMFQLADENKIQEATDLLQSNEMMTVAKNEEDAITALTNENIQEAKNQSGKNDSLAATMSTIVWSVLGVSIIIAMWLAFYTSHQISSSVLQIADRMHSLRNICIANLEKGSKQLAAGDLDVHIEIGTKPIEIKTNDELGQLSENVNNVISLTQATVASVENAVQIIREMITETKNIVNATALGQLNLRGNADKFTGGYKEVISGLNNTLEAFANPLNESGTILARLADGDLTARMEGEYKGEFKKFKDNLNILSESLNKVISDITNAIEATASASAQISSSSEEMAAGAQEQSAQANEVASAISQMTSTILETTRNVQTASNTSKRAGSIASEGGKAVNETVEGMNNIAEVVSKAAVTVQALGKSSNQIGEIVKVIDEIADQTNLLALNAAIEAARAGEQGRGFAVVADEVRKLAERTTKATKEIAGMIKQIQEDTTGAVESMNLGTQEVEKGKELAARSGKSLEEIIATTNQVVDVINQVAAASEEQSSAAEQISTNIDGISKVTNESATGTQQIARAAEDLNRLTINLQEMVVRFKIDNSRLEVRSNGKMTNGRKELSLA